MMDLYLIEYRNFHPYIHIEKRAVVDDYKSLIWTKRYAEFGDCELYIEATKKNLELFKIGYLLQRNDDDMICRIKSVELQTDEEEGDYLVITGQDYRSILNQRIVWNQTNFSGTLGGYVYTLISQAISNPSNISRKIMNFDPEPSIINHASESIVQQASYVNLGEKIIELCKTYNYGSKVTLHSGVMFKFNMYKGVDRSYAQNENNRVMFSPDFDNIKTSKYLLDYSDFKNVALVGGEGEGTARTRVTVGEATGLDRYEIFVDADDISSETEEGVQIDYNQLLENRGLEVLTEHKVTKVFDGEVEPNYTYKFKTDYDLGDIVQVRNEYGIDARARITEVIESFDENGYDLIPSFEYMED